MKDKNQFGKKIQSRKINHVILLWMILISFSSCALLTLFTIQVQYRNFQHESQISKERYLEEQKRGLQQKIEEAVNYASFNSQQTRNRLKTEIKSRVYEAWNIASHIYQQNSETLAKEEIANLIKESLRPIRFNAGRGYYFIVSLQGIEELYPTRPQLEGMNLIELRDNSGKLVIKDEIETVQKQGEGFVTGYWPNPIIPGDSGSLQYSFVKIFKPMNWLIGTGEFLSNVEQELQNETLEWLSKIRFGQGSYIFVDTYKGDALLMDGKSVQQPTNIWDLEDPNGVKIIQEETRIATSQPEGGFLRYMWRKEHGDVAVPVISFVKAFPEWKWVVGSSIYINDIEKALAAQQDRLKNNVFKDIYTIVIGFLVSIPLITLLSFLVSASFNKELQVFLSFFKQIQNTNDAIDLSNLKIEEFRELGEAANQMIAIRKEAEVKLERLSRTDPLTELSNRRDMLERIAQEIKRANRTGEVFSFVLADIDHFKTVNDTYGHDAGDSVLKEFSRLLKQSARETDAIARWGGEEFLILLLSSDKRDALPTAEKIRKKIAEHTFNFGGHKIHVTLTLGVVTWEKGLTFEDILTMADSALYKGKQQGRNRVVQYTNK